MEAKREYRPHTQQSLVDVPDLNLINALKLDINDEQLELFRQNQHLRRSELAKLLNISKLSLNFITYNMKSKPNYKSHNRPNPYAQEVIDRLKKGQPQYKICREVDVSTSLVRYYNRKIKAGYYE